MVDRQKRKLRRLFNKYDKATRTLIETADTIKAEARGYWKSQGWDVGSVLPRLETLRDDVFKED